jgi:pilus assembly protein FimV
MSIKLLISSGVLSALLLLNPAVLAVGLGSVEVETHLNEPLRAQIPLQSVSGIDADEIEVTLGSPEEFSRVGIDRPAVLTQLSFELERTARGPVIRVSSDEAISEPFLSFLVRVSWPQGRLLREYTILLDPPVTAPAAAPQRDQGPSQVVEREGPADTGAPERETVAAPGADAPSPGVADERDAAAPTGGGSYGPVASGETLWNIAERLRPDSSISVNQMMLALLRTNPDAFFRDNINALRRGAVLRVPDRDQIQSLDGSEALQAVRRHNDLWQDHRRQLADEAPTVVAGGEPQERAPVDEGAGDEESGLELVPPREGEAEEGAATSGPGSEEAEADREALRQELARTREDLLARREENAELDGRVDELEAQVERLQRLLELKNEELAAIQQAEGSEADEPDTVGREAGPEEGGSADEIGMDAAEAPDEADARQEGAEDSADAPVAAEEPDAAGEEPGPGAESQTEAEEEPEPAAPPPPSGGGWMALLLSPVALGIACLLLIGIGVALFLHRRGGRGPELTVQR